MRQVFRALCSQREQFKCVESCYLYDAFNSHQLMYTPLFVVSMHSIER